jgi:rhodanese-related sulfurtransferase
METMIHRSSLHVPTRGPRRSFAIGVLAPSTATAAVSSSPSLIDPAAAEALLAAPPAGLVVLDVRTPEEFAAGHLDGAVMIDFQSPSFAADVVALGEDTPVFVYCRSGNRSAQAVAAMVQLGFTDLTELDGGIVAWEAAGLPLV